jgi:N-ethylmaleimide reductase
LKRPRLPGIVEDYRKAARAAIDAGFDGVEIHAANGYLIDQFLRADINDRTDQYGGSIENRARFLFEVVDVITKEIGARRTGIRISPVTPANDSHPIRPRSRCSTTSSKAWPNTISPSSTSSRVRPAATAISSRATSPSTMQGLRAAYEKAGGKASWMVNNGYDRQLAIDTVESGKADLIAFGKPFISNPDLVERLKDNAPLNAIDQATLYGGGPKGYIDYPALEKVA